MADAVAVQSQLLRGSAGSLTATFYDDNGVAADPGVTIVAVTGTAGGTVIASGTAGGSGTTRSVAYTGTHSALLDTWTLTWTTTSFGTLTTTAEVVGSFLFSIAEARTWDRQANGLPPLSDATKYPTQQIEAKRAAITDQFTSILGYSPIPRLRESVQAGSGTTQLILPELYTASVRSAESRASGTATWTALDTTNLADVLVDPLGILIRETLGTWTWGTSNWRIRYETGRWTQVPGDLRDAALIAAVWELVGTNLSERAISISTPDGGTQNLWTTGLSARGLAVHSLPAVDAVLRRYAENRLAVA
jgi:hypothetical protein